MLLYAAGTIFNLLSHLVVRALKEDEPGFFTGYDSLGACMVIISNIFIGLAITAVYKCKLSLCFLTLVSANQSRRGRRYQVPSDSRGYRDSPIFNTNLFRDRARVSCHSRDHRYLCQLVVVC
jgi:hypothetical protein